MSRGKKSLIKSLRLKEIILMTGFSFIGILFTETQTWNNWLKNITVFVFVLCYVMAVYFLNSFADYENDIQSKRLKIIGNLSKTNYFTLLVVFGILFSLLAISININVFVFCILAFLLWLIYYLPPLRLKSSYLLGTLVHFTAGIFHFHTGYCSYNTYNLGSMAISVYFALLLSVGHFHHEIIDYESDKVSGSKTTAVRIGINKMHLLRTTLSGFTLIYWITIYLTGFTDKIEFGLFFIPTATLLVMSGIMREKEVKIFQNSSRSMFLIAGFLLLIIKTIF
ncbi:MAG: UbiA family prenyltransferase [Bacteroidia bacterium]